LSGWGREPDKVKWLVQSPTISFNNPLLKQPKQEATMKTGPSDDPLHSPGSEEERFGKVVGYVRDDDQPISKPIQPTTGGTRSWEVPDDGYVPSY
jgi:hypothetical protein